MNLLNKLKKSLSKTRDNLISKVKNLFVKKEINEQLWQDLEETLILADVSYNSVEKIINNMKEIVRIQNIKDASKLMQILESEIYSIINIIPKEEKNIKPLLKLIIGVNGTGKTTTIAKLANLYKNKNKKVILGAADTFRAGAIKQLQIWADKLNTKLIKHQEGSDPSAVVYDTISSAIAKNYDIALIDTAGRLHSKKNLMNELEKIYRVSLKLVKKEQIESILVLDSTIGKNALNQVKIFSKYIPIDSIILTKLDTTAKGGIIISILEDFSIPIKYITYGEDLYSIAEFEPENFIKALFEK